MARPKKYGVDYFPHDVDASSSRTLFTLESKYGNDGYAFWFKLLEILGSQDGLYYDCRNPSNWLFLLAKTRVDEVSATEILNTLSQVDAIDSDLWRKKVIWIHKFSERLSDVFRKRGTETPLKPSFCDGNPSKTDESVAESTQSKVKESKVKESKEHIRDSDKPNTPSAPEPKIDYQSIADKFNAICKSLPKVSKLTDSRKRAIKSATQTIEDAGGFEKLFTTVEQSDFLTGRVGNFNGCGFDWILKPANLTKIIEGNYANKTGKPKKPLKETSFDLSKYEDMVNNFTPVYRK